MTRSIITRATSAISAILVAALFFVVAASPAEAAPREVAVSIGIDTDVACPLADGDSRYEFTFENVRSEIATEFDWRVKRTDTPVNTRFVTVAPGAKATRTVDLAKGEEVRLSVRRADGTVLVNQLFVGGCNVIGNLVTDYVETPEPDLVAGLVANNTSTPKTSVSATITEADGSVHNYPFPSVAPNSADGYSIPTGSGEYRGTLQWGSRVIAATYSHH